MGVSDGLAEMVGRGDVDGVTLVDGALGIEVGNDVGKSDDPRIDGRDVGLVVGVSDVSPEGVDEGSSDGTRISRQIPHDRSLRTLGNSMHVSQQSADPAVPLYMNQPLLKSKHPSGTTLHSPAKR